MTKTKIIESINLYLKRLPTDYALMIAGDWGVGKTHFLKKDIFPIIKELELRPIYISLIGLNSDSQLENQFLCKINPFYNSTNKSVTAKEADYLESIISGEEKPELNIPKNIVLCFDDLERINPTFFESALGLINVYIEHYKIKCIFLCNENIIKKNSSFPNYRVIKEKYIRFTYSFSPIIETVLLEKISTENSSPIISQEHIASYDVKLIDSVFKKSNHYNLRTLFFVISIFEQILTEIDKSPNKPQRSESIINLILNYCCFYAIETKKGTPYTLLDKITIANNPDISLKWLDLEGMDDSPFDNSEDDKDEPSKDESVNIKQIQKRYFSDKSANFERFISVAELIKSGYLDAEFLIKEINTLAKVFEKVEERTFKAEMANKLINVFDLSDSELIPIVNAVINEAEKGTFDLQTYLQTYRQLVWLESCKIIGIEVNNELTEKFKQGAIIASKSGELRYISNLSIQFLWDPEDDSEYALKYKDFLEYIEELNNHLNKEENTSRFEDVITAIKENDSENLYKLVTDKSQICFIKKHAKLLYSELNKANTSTTNQFFIAIKNRYAKDGSISSQTLTNELDFIITFHDQIKNDSDLQPSKEKLLSKVPLTFLMTYFQQLLKNN